jgi:hypothetical protein
VLANLIHFPYESDLETSHSSGSGTQANQLIVLAPTLPSGSNMHESVADREWGGLLLYTARGALSRNKNMKLNFSSESKFLFYENVTQQVIGQT